MSHHHRRAGMYKLLHWIFGWEYVGVEWAYSFEIRRLRSLADGRHYVICYGSLIVLNDSLREFLPITDGAVSILKEVQESGDE